jgi:hypothetical protein
LLDTATRTFLYNAELGMQQVDLASMLFDGKRLHFPDVLVATPFLKLLVLLLFETLSNRQAIAKN